MSRITLLVYNDNGDYVIEMDTRKHRYASLELLLRDIKLLFNNSLKEETKSENDGSYNDTEYDPDRGKYR